MLYIYSSNVRTGHFADFEKAVASHQQRFAASQPAGWTLKGFFFKVFGFGDAHVEVHFEVANYAAFDSAQQTAAKKGDYEQLWTEFHKFLDPATASGRLLKPVGGKDTLVVGC